MNYLDEIEDEIKDLGFDIISKDFKRPWGGFMVINENQAQEFANEFFNGVDIESLKKGGRLSPKILIIKPKSKLSWQYHNRRSEIWRICKGEVHIIKSDNNNQGKPILFNVEDQVYLKRKERHRAIGLNNFVVIAEVWQHTDSNHPSDENDIVRLDDEYGR